MLNCEKKKVNYTDTKFLYFCYTYTNFFNYMKNITLIPFIHYTNLLICKILYVVSLYDKLL